MIIQEAIRYNKLLTVIQSSLNDLLKALKGLVVMSEALEKMTLSLFSNMVPVLWASKAYPSLKPLGIQNKTHIFSKSRKVGICSFTVMIYLQLLGWRI